MILNTLLLSGNLLAIADFFEQMINLQKEKTFPDPCIISDLFRMFLENLNKNTTIQIQENEFTMVSAKWRLFCPGLNELTT